MAKATAIEIAVWFGVAPVVVNVRKFQPPIIQQFIVMQIFGHAEHLVGNVELYKRCDNIITSKTNFWQCGLGQASAVNERHRMSK